jgi:hypothetical protein
MPVPMYMLDRDVHGYRGRFTRTEDRVGFTYKNKNKNKNKNENKNENKNPTATMVEIGLKTRVAYGERCKVEYLRLLPTCHEYKEVNLIVFPRTSLRRTGQENKSSSTSSASHINQISVISAHFPSLLVSPRTTSFSSTSFKLPGYSTR